jgi:hypothetical protein
MNIKKITTKTALVIATSAMMSGSVFAACSADIDMASNKITNLVMTDAAGTSSEAANKNYVDNQITSKEITLPTNVFSSSSSLVATKYANKQICITGMLEKITSDCTGIQSISTLSSDIRPLIMDGQLVSHPSVSGQWFNYSPTTSALALDCRSSKTFPVGNKVYVNTCDGMNVPVSSSFF